MWSLAEAVLCRRGYAGRSGPCVIGGHRGSARGDSGDYVPVSGVYVPVSGDGVLSLSVFRFWGGNTDDKHQQTQHPDEAIDDSYKKDVTHQRVPSTKVPSEPLSGTAITGKAARDGSNSRSGELVRIQCSMSSSPSSSRSSSIACSSVICSRVCIIRSWVLADVVGGPAGGTLKGGTVGGAAVGVSGVAANATAGVVVGTGGGPGAVAIPRLSVAQWTGHRLCWMALQAAAKRAARPMGGGAPASLRNALFEHRADANSG